MDVSIIGVWAGLLKVRKGMNCGHEKVPNNVALHLIAFFSKSLSSAGWWYNTIDWGSTWHMTWALKISPLTTDHKPLVAMVNKDFATHHTTYPLIQHAHFIQTWP